MISRNKRELRFPGCKASGDLAGKPTQYRGTTKPSLAFSRGKGGRAASRSGCIPTASLIRLQQNLSECLRHAGAYKGLQIPRKTPTYHIYPRTSDPRGDVARGASFQGNCINKSKIILRQPYRDPNKNPVSTSFLFS